jgi:hypothetical protein
MLGWEPASSPARQILGRDIGAFDFSNERAKVMNNT